jgi:ornithine cyclodeaminase/alanine dehydrogenase-like protein (mu-crystallin family)
VVVDQREAAWEEAGDLIVPLRDGVIGENVISAELGDIVRGVAPPGSSGHEITLFKSVGNAAQDVAIGGAALRLAERAGLGREVPF